MGCVCKRVNNSRLLLDYCEVTDDTAFGNLLQQTICVLRFKVILTKREHIMHKEKKLKKIHIEEFHRPSWKTSDVMPLILFVFKIRMLNLIIQS